MEVHYAGVVLIDFFRVGGCIIEKLHHFFCFFPGRFLIVKMQFCSVWLALTVRLCMNSPKGFLPISGNFWIHLDLVMGIHMLGAPFGALWIHNFVPSTGAVSGVV